MKSCNEKMNKFAWKSYIFWIILFVGKHTYLVLGSYHESISKQTECNYFFLLLNVCVISQKTPKWTTEKGFILIHVLSCACTVPTLIFPREWFDCTRNGKDATQYRSVFSFSLIIISIKNMTCWERKVHIYKVG